LWIAGELREGGDDILIGVENGVEGDGGGAEFLVSVLLGLTIIRFAAKAFAKCGSRPAFSISSNSQYQWPVVSTATGVPAGRFFK